MAYQNFSLDVDTDGIALVTWDMQGRSMNVLDVKTIEELRALPEVGSLETWAHLDIIKEDYTRTLGRIVRP